MWVFNFPAISVGSVVAPVIFPDVVRDVLTSTLTPGGRPKRDCLAQVSKSINVMATIPSGLNPSPFLISRKKLILMASADAKTGTPRTMKNTRVMYLRRRIQFESPLLDCFPRMRNPQTSHTKENGKISQAKSCASL